MKTKLIVLCLTLIMVGGGIFSLYIGIKKYSNTLLDEVKNSSESISEYFSDKLSEIKNLELSPLSSSTTSIKGYALMDLNGKVVYSFDVPSNLIGKCSDTYRYVVMNGEYISPYFIFLNGEPLILVGVKTSDNNRIAAALVRTVKCGFPNSFLVDRTGLSVSLNEEYERRNFLSIISLNRYGIILKDGYFFFVEPVKFIGYTVVVKKSLWSILSFFTIRFYLWVMIFSLLLFLVFLSHHSINKKVGPLLSFAEFMKNLDGFRKYDSKNLKNELFFNYNKLVEKHEKLDRDYSELIKEMTETNFELTELNKLLIEFSMLFNEVKSERKSLEEAFKISFRRMLDFSKPITGIGMRYKKMEIYLGTVNAFNFESESDGRISMSLKTESSGVRYVVSVDRFSMSERTREIIRTLLYHITTFLSMYEIFEMNKNSMKYDPLTNLLTRQEFEEMIKREEALAKRENKFLSFMIIDVKGMSKFNEKYSRLKGDELLKFIAKTIMKNIRLTDIAARYGEDEFVICFYGMKKEDAMKKRQQIISQIMSFRYEISLKHAILSYPTDGENTNKIISLLEKEVAQG